MADPDYPLLLIDSIRTTVVGGIVLSAMFARDAISPIGGMISGGFPLEGDLGAVEPTPRAVGARVSNPNCLE